MNQRAERTLSRYPKFYLLKTSWDSLSLFASEGRHRGCAFGVFYDSKKGNLTLYGLSNFRHRGGLAWSKYAEHERVTISREEVIKLAERVGE